MTDRLLLWIESIDAERQALEADERLREKIRQRSSARRTARQRQEYGALTRGKVVDWCLDAAVPVTAYEHRELHGSSQCSIVPVWIGLD